MIGSHPSSLMFDKHEHIFFLQLESWRHNYLIAAVSGYSVVLFPDHTVEQ